MRRLDGATGAVTWDMGFTLAEGAQPSGFALDRDGTLYVAVQERTGTPYGEPVDVVAFQLDVGPARGTLCDNGGRGNGGFFVCNRHRNGWVHDYGPP